MCLFTIRSAAYYFGVYWFMLLGWETAGTCIGLWMTGANFLNLMAAQGQLHDLDAPLAVFQYQFFVWMPTSDTNDRRIRPVAPPTPQPPLHDT